MTIIEMRMQALRGGPSTAPPAPSAGHGDAGAAFLALVAEAAAGDAAGDTPADKRRGAAAETGQDDAEVPERCLLADTGTPAPRHPAALGTSRTFLPGAPDMPDASPASEAALAGSLPAVAPPLAGDPSGAPTFSAGADDGPGAGLPHGHGPGRAAQGDVRGPAAQLDATGPAHPAGDTPAATGSGRSDPAPDRATAASRAGGGTPAASPPDPPAASAPAAVLPVPPAATRERGPLSETVSGSAPEPVSGSVPATAAGSPPGAPRAAAPAPTEPAATGPDDAPARPEQAAPRDAASRPAAPAAEPGAADARPSPQAAQQPAAQTAVSSVPQAIAAGAEPDWRLAERPAVELPRTAPTAGEAAAQAAPRAREIAAQVAVSLRGADGHRIEIRLDPSELGRVQISLRPGEGGTLQAVVLAERPEVHDLMRRHADLLAEELRAAGYGEVRLDFQAGGREDRGAWPDAPRAAGHRDAPDAASPVPAAARAPAMIAAGRLDIRL